jgi:hypothetical protein
MNRTDFLKKLGLGSIALATGSKLTANDMSEDEMFDYIINNITYQTYNPGELETIDHMFKTPSGYVISPKQLVYNIELILKDEIERFKEVGYNTFHYKIFGHIKEEYLWLQKNYSWDEIHQHFIDEGLRKIEDITKTFPKR